jgi:hypothetical protein
VKDLNASLLADQEKWKARVAEAEKRCEVVGNVKDAKIADLEEQVRDLMFMIESQAKLDKLPEEERAALRDGSVVGVAAAPAPKTATRRKSSGKK